MLVRALLGGQGMAVADRQFAPDALVAYRYAPRQVAVAYIPGFREPRPVALAGDRATYSGQGLLAICARPPRRIGIGLPSALLRHVTLVDTPATEPFDEAYAAVTARVATRAVVVFVVDPRRPFRSLELDLLATLDRAGSTVVFATHGRPGPEPLRHRLPAPLHRAPWFTIDGPADVAALRAAIIELAATRRRPGRPSVEPAPTGPAGVTSKLDTGIHRCRLAVVRRLASELAAAQEVCQDRIAGRGGIRRLPDELDRQLQALSIRLTADLDARCRAVTERTMIDLFGRIPRPRVLRRLAAEVRAACPDQPERVLLVTSDATVTTLYGTGSLAGMCADPDDVNAPLVRPIEVAVTAGGYLRWRRNEGGSSLFDAESWLRRALDSVAAELLTEVDARCAEVQRTLVRLVGELTGPQHRSMSFAE
jgi:hypothetical protein